MHDADVFSCPTRLAFIDDALPGIFAFGGSGKTASVPFVSLGSDMSAPGMIDAPSLAGLKRKKPRRFSLRGFFRV
jgi:hypothetical protein